MSEILQGTTPSLEIKINTEDFAVGDVVELELSMWNGEVSTKYGLSDVTVDTEENSIIYRFTEAETLALIPNRSLYYQARFLFADGTIVGTKKEKIEVADLYSKDVMGG